jgi:hypothetical protein
MDRKPAIEVALGLPMRKEHEEEDGKPSDEDVHESKLAAANEMLAAFHSRNAEKLVAALETFCDLHEPEEGEGEHEDDAEPEEEGEEEMREGEQP